MICNIYKNVTFSSDKNRFRIDKNHFWPELRDVFKES